MRIVLAGPPSVAFRHGLAVSIVVTGRPVIRRAELPDFPLRIATRTSPLALAQVEAVRARLTQACSLGPEAFEIVALKTTGDRILDRALSEAGGKGLFTKEIEEALLEGRADIAVHSAKDLPTDHPPGLGLAAILPREDPRDAFISRIAGSLEELPDGAVVGTASLRRAALVRRLRPGLRTVMLRGNVQTRLAKLEAGEVQATLLALAGLKRLDMGHEATAILDPDSFPPALGQGTIAVQTRLDDTGTNTLVHAIDDAAARAALECERAFLAVLDGSCRTPIAGHARVTGDRLDFRGLVLSPDGATAHEASRSGAASEAGALGVSAGEEVARVAGPDFLAALKRAM
jgi:hydroxymethylbilane synthase